MLATAMLLVGLVASAAAVPLIGKDGKIHACYRVKGKPKGNLRVVLNAKALCKRGERKVAWSVASTSSQGSSGQNGSGQQGSSGSAGSNGSAGAQGAPGTTATLTSEITSLNLKLEALEDVLKGVTNSDLTGTLNKLNGVTGGDLTGVLGKLNGLTNNELTKAVDAVPVVDDLCSQATGLIANVNGLNSALDDLSLNGVLTALGGVLNVPGLPTELDPFTCSA